MGGRGCVGGEGEVYFVESAYCMYVRGCYPTA